MLEIELKAWSDIEAAARKLASLGKTAKKTSVKEDVYYVEPGADPATCNVQKDRIVRVRIQDGTAIVTAKQKTIVDGIEQSREIEFEASDAQAFRALLDYMGYHAFIAKRKESRAFVWGEGIHVELNRISGLGDFVEIEALLDEGAPAEQVAATRAQLVSILAELGVDPSKIESRPYAELLRERAAGERGTGRA